MIPVDKILHVLASCIVGVIGGAIAHFFTDSIVMCASIAFLLVFIVGMGKEIYDEKTYGGSESSDWASDLIGGLVGMLITVLFLL